MCLAWTIDHLNKLCQDWRQPGEVFLASPPPPHTEAELMALLFLVSSIYLASVSVHILKWVFTFLYFELDSRIFEGRDFVFHILPPFTQKINQGTLCLPSDSFTLIMSQGLSNLVFPKLCSLHQQHQHHQGILKTANSQAPFAESETEMGPISPCLTSLLDDSDTR